MGMKIWMTSIFCIAILMAIVVGSLDNMNAEDRIKIKFNSFISFYNINPDRWELNNATVWFKIKVEDNYPFPAYEKHIKFKFNLIDTIKYKHWKRQKIKNDIILKNCEEYQKVLGIIKQDIQVTQQESSRLNNEGLDILQTIINT